jgi:hypothetical protein
MPGFEPATNISEGHSANPYTTDANKKMGQILSF